MRYKLKVYNIWEYGQRVDSEGKPHQEDNIFPAYEQQKKSDRLFILCDGMGGHEAGEVASSTVCSAMSKSIFESAPNAEGDFNDDNLRKAIADAFDSLDALPLGNVSAEKKMGTTMTFLKFHNKGCTIAHIGDSRVYHIRPGKGRDETKILFKTNDHSLVNDLIRVGELTPEEAKQSKQKNIITRAMQPKMERRPKPDVYHTVDIKPGDYFYMCSDGMLEQMEDENLLFNFSEATGDDKNKVKILTQATSQNLDNHSAIIVHILDVIDPLPAELAPKVPTVTKPAPIMAEVDEDSVDEENGVMMNDKLFVETGNISHQKDNTIRFDSKEKNFAKGLSKSKNIRLVRYISLAIIVVLLALCLFIVSSKFTKSRVVQPEKTEGPQKPTKKPDKKDGHHGNAGLNNSTQQPVKPNENSAPDELNSEGHAGNAGVVNTNVPAKIQNALPAQTDQTTNNNISSNSHAQNNEDHTQTPSSVGINLNHATQQTDNVVSSDQQTAIDAVKTKKRK